MAASPPRAEVRTTSPVSDYVLPDEIARGGIGVVYKSQQVGLNRIVALKMIRAGQLASDEDFGTW